MEELKIKRSLLVLIFLSTFVRLIIASITELGNDEVYYWTYSLFPSLSYFDHPPMIGLLIRLTTAGTFLNSETFVRLGAIISGSICLWLIYKIGVIIGNPKAGLYAALLYTSSLYGSIIAGTFILPDSPQTVFWLASLLFLLKSVVKKPGETNAKKNLYLAGISIGLALLSKYHSVFLWAGAFLFIIFKNRAWLKQKDLYISLLFSLAIFSPVIIWNYNENFISFTFHSSRVGFFPGGFNANTFMRELLGQIFYNNPVNFILIVIVIISLLRNKFEMDSSIKSFLLFTSLPVILLFLLFSVFRPTFPHWSAPGYFSLLLIASIWLSGKKIKKLIPGVIKMSLSIFVIFISAGIMIINYGVIKFPESNIEQPTKLGDKDISLEMFGWKQIGEEFKKIHEKNINSGNISRNAPIITNKWYIAAHVDYYAAHPLGLETYALGPVTDIRNYLYINRKRTSINHSLYGYYFTTSHDFKDPAEIVRAAGFEINGKPDTISVYRGGRIIEYAFVYKLNLYRQSSF